jgi:hypothetical protein
MAINDNNRRRFGTRDDGYGWGIPAAVIAAVLIVGGLIYMSMSDSRTTTASNDRPVATQSGPAGSQAPVSSPTTTPAPKQ